MVLEGHWPAGFRCVSAPTHLVLAEHEQVIQPLSQVCWSKYRQYPCRAEALEDQVWTSLARKSYFSVEVSFILIQTWRWLKWASTGTLTLCSLRPWSSPVWADWQLQEESWWCRTCYVFSFPSPAWMNQNLRNQLGAVCFDPFVGLQGFSFEYREIWFVLHSQAFGRRFIHTFFVVSPAFL